VVRNVRIAPIAPGLAQVVVTIMAALVWYITVRVVRLQSVNLGTVAQQVIGTVVSEVIHLAATLLTQLHIRIIAIEGDH
jgi:hypothetical protein